MADVVEFRPFGQSKMGGGGSVRTVSWDGVWFKRPGHDECMRANSMVGNGLCGAGVCKLGPNASLHLLLLGGLLPISIEGLDFVNHRFDGYAQLVQNLGSWGTQSEAVDTDNSSVDAHILPP